ncbi:MAG: 50S ribosomal protein L18 [Alphaproteobacteria bacterium RIFCSPLOWO2_01_FULL_40_26]|nr:MAG: 50S ribosomal protein L18 [Alphaproteobacteria bacterium RIFCSPHIGHO2_02_FULL_40_34]OFW87857.1 MAG: 50S ribosomal protein L18 [Alphaproteobacteria bacterium RIFCSPHIGHO2_01_FULL_40_8]OFW95092.1 MAG: 50S ribosomal protein L18 [Alphaproteobacteria bacterium RIFCSPLOWO2_01_FULL_40_26]OFX09085.1 MAG: 50S ribosomal protein L18 [Alphaproteobacteria bacterium RIFCSPLOWO2_02_FULL_40_19]OFX12173.1 MAG: 50S ribosomal protein L18 [Alphaproteobacteria bacterium RIFCSPLOWO2_12_FULL_40_11]
MLTNYERRKFRVRNHIEASNKGGRPRLVVSRSNKNIYAQLIDAKGKVLCSFSTLNFEDNKKANKKTNGTEKAKFVGQEFAKICLKNGVKEVVFDKGAYIYNGRVKALAEACREAGLQF